MTFTIPTWLLWTLGLVIGVPLVLAILALAVFGWMAASAVARPRW